MKFGIFRKDQITLDEICRIKENEAELKNIYKIGIGIQKTIIAAKKPLTFAEWRAFIHYQLQIGLAK